MKVIYFIWNRTFWEGFSQYVDFAKQRVGGYQTIKTILFPNFFLAIFADK